MPLMTTKPMFDLAYSGGFAVGAFNVNNMELAQAILDACAKEKSPLILQIDTNHGRGDGCHHVIHGLQHAESAIPRVGGVAAELSTAQIVLGLQTTLTF